MRSAARIFRPPFIGGGNSQNPKHRVHVIKLCTALVANPYRRASHAYSWVLPCVSRAVKEHNNMHGMNGLHVNGRSWVGVVDVRWSPNGTCMRKWENMICESDSPHCCQAWRAYMHNVQHMSSSDNATSMALDNNNHRNEKAKSTCDRMQVLRVGVQQNVCSCDIGGSFPRGTIKLSVTPSVQCIQAVSQGNCMPVPCIELA